MRLIITGDLHLRHDLPRCRIDSDWINTQRMQLEFIRDMLINCDAEIAILGDIFHYSQVPDILKNMFLDVFKDQKVYILAGQHDLPYHKWDNVNSSSFGILWKSGNNIKSLEEIGQSAHWNKEFKGNDTGLYFMHRPIFEDRVPPFMCAINAEQSLDEFSFAKWIFAGDQHHGFHYTKNGRHVIVPGCMNRQAADFKNYQPKIWFVNTEEDFVKSFDVPDEEILIDDSYIVEEKNRISRISSIAETIKNNESISLDYKDNVNKLLLEQDFTEGTKNIIMDLFGG